MSWGSLVSRVVALWQGLTRPLRPMGSDSEYRSSRLMSTLVILFFSLAFLASTLLLLLDSESAVVRLVFYLILGSLPFWVAAYVLSRYGFYKISAGLIAVLCTLCIFATFFPGGSLIGVFFLIIPITLLSLFLPVRYAVSLMMADLVGIVLLGWLALDIPSTHIGSVIGPLTFLLTGSALVLLMTRRRGALEAQRSELEMQRARYRAIVQDQTDLICRFLPDGTITFVNQAAYRYLGVTEKELLGRPIKSVLLHEDWEGLKQLAASVTPEQPTVSYEHPVRLSDGKRRWHQRTDRGIFDRSGNLVEFQSVGRDITERREAQDALQRERQIFHTLAEAAVYEKGIQGFCQRILEELVDSLNFDLGTMRLYEQPEQLLAVTAVAGERAQELADKLTPQQFDDPHTVAAYVARSGQVIFAPDVFSHPIMQTHRARLRELAVRSFISWPILSSQKSLLGVIQLASSIPQSMSEGDRTLFSAIAETLGRTLERYLATGALEVSEEKFRSVVQQSVDGIVLVDETGALVEWNQGMEQITELERAEVLGRPMLEVLSQSLPAEHRGRGMSAQGAAGMRRILESTRGMYSGRRIEGEIERPDGSRRKVQLLIFPVDAGHNFYVGCIVRDNTAEKEAEEAVKQRNKEMALLHRAGQTLTSKVDLTELLDATLQETSHLLDALGCSIWLLDGEENDLVCCQVTGPGQESVRGWRLPAGVGIAGWVVQNGQSIIVSDSWADERYYREVERETDRPMRSILAAPLVASGQVMGVLEVVDEEPGRFSESDLELVESLAAYAAIAIENARLVANLEDKVLARTAEILEEKEKVEAILNNVDDAIVMGDAMMRIRYVNPAFTALTGYSREEIEGQTSDHLFDESVPVPVLDLAKETISRGLVWQADTVIRRKDGHSYDASLTIFPVQNAEGEIVAFVSTHRDISQKKELERARSQFLTNVSHELRTPLTNVSLYAQLLQQVEGSSDKAAHYHRTLNAQIERLKNLVQDVIRLAELEAGHSVESWEPVSVQAMVHGVLRNFENKAREAGLSLELKGVPADLPPVQGDRVWLGQALSKLVENAINFTPSGGEVSVEVRLEGGADFKWAAIDVKDSGPGIGREEQPLIFDRFFRGMLAENGNIPGTGLGLSIVREIMAAHGGWVTVESDLGQGSTFTLWLRGGSAEPG